MTQRCHDCGKFRSEFKAWKMYYSGFPPIPDEEIYRCADCFEKLGPFHPQPGIKPEYSCGLIP